MIRSQIHSQLASKLAVVSALSLAGTLGCSFSHDAGKEELTGTDPVFDGGFNVDRLYIGDAVAGSEGGGAPPGVVFTPATTGAYGLGAPVTGADPTVGGGSAGSAGCNNIVGIARDFKGKNEAGGHPDFEAFAGSDATTGLVADQLDSNSKPIYASKCEGGTMSKSDCPYGQMTTSQASFDEWYRNTDGVNKPYYIYFQLAPNNGVTTFSSSSFFPLDGTGWGNSGADSKGVQHNFGFTTELHTTFKYGGGEHFTFVGDDDVWVFINGKLAVDLGGVHPQVTGTIDLDAAASSLGIVAGKNYPMDLFQAERHTSQSNFRIDTNLVFVDCGVIIF